MCNSGNSRNLAVALSALILASCAWAKTKDNYIAYGVPAECYYIPNPGESEESENDKWWAPDLSREEFLYCYELQKKTDLKLRTVKKEALGDLSDALLEEAARRRESRDRMNRCYQYGIC